MIDVFCEIPLKSKDYKLLTLYYDNTCPFYSSLSHYTQGRREGKMMRYNSPGARIHRDPDIIPQFFTR